MARDYGDSPVSLTIDWIPLATPSWRAMAGVTTPGTTFGEPGEASLYFFEHHRYDAIELDLLAQRDHMVHARATVSGDIDRLGIPSLIADDWLRFAGIRVALTNCCSRDIALARLRGFTDTAGLSLSPSRHRNTFDFTATTT